MKNKLIRFQQAIVSTMAFVVLMTLAVAAFGEYQDDDGYLNFQNGARLHYERDAKGERVLYKSNYKSPGKVLPAIKGPITDFAVNQASTGFLGWAKRHGPTRHIAYKRLTSGPRTITALQSPDTIYIVNQEGQVAQIPARPDFRGYADKEEGSDKIMARAMIFGRINPDTNKLLVLVELGKEGTETTEMAAFISDGEDVTNLGDLSTENLLMEIERAIPDFDRETFSDSLNISRMYPPHDYKVPPKDEAKDESKSRDDDRDTDPKVVADRPVSLDLTGEEREFLKQFVDLSAEVKSSSKVFDVADQEEVNDLRRALAKKEVGSAIIVGEAGSGKTEFVRSFVKQVVEGKFPEIPAGTVVIQIDAASLTADTSLRGQFEKKVDLIKKIARKNHNLIFFFDEVHSLKGSGSHSGSDNDFFQMVRTELASGQMRFIGTTTNEDFERSIAGDPSLRRRAPPVYKKPFPEEKLPGILQSWAQKVGYKPLAPELMKKILNLSAEFDALGTNLSKAVRLLEDVYADALITNKAQDKLTVVDVESSAARLYRIDKSEFNPKLRWERLAKLPQSLDARVFGLDEVKHALVEDMTMALAGTQDRTLPRVRRLFAGPRGVAKTYLARVFAESMGLPFVKISMSEYASGKSADELLRQVASALRKNPFSVVVFDELEKAPMHIQNSLLQLLDSDHFYVTESVGPNGMGRNTTLDRINVSSAMFIATTNAGERVILDHEYRRTSGPGKAGGKGKIGFTIDNKDDGDKDKDLASKPLPEITSAELKAGVIEGGVSPYVYDRMMGVHAFYPPRTMDEFKGIIKMKLSESVELQKKQVGPIQIKNEEAYVDALATKYFKPGLSCREVIVELNRALGLALAYARKDYEASGKNGSECALWLIEL